MPDIGTAYIRIAPNMTGIQGKIAGGLKGSGSAFSDQFAGEVSGRSSVIIGAIAGVASAATQQAMNLISSSIGDAVQRVDALASFPRVLQAMGIGADDAKAATDKLNRSLQGLPTRLQDGTAGVQQFIAAGLGADKATDAYLAMNNALLASGSNAQDTNIVMESLTRALAGGSTQATTIQAALSRMPTALLGLQKATGKTTDELYKFYAANPRQLTEDLINLNKKGGGGLASLESQAREATVGIGTSFTNMQAAIVRGLGLLLTAVGQENISQAISGIGTAFESVMKVVAATIPPIISVISGFVGFISSNKDVFGPIAAGILAVVAALTAWRVAVGLWSAVTTAATAIQAAFNAVLAANPITLIILAVVALTAALAYFFTQTEAGKGIIQSFGSTVQRIWNDITNGLNAVGNNIRNVFAGAWNFVTGLWNQAGNFFNGVRQNIMNAFNGIADIGKNIVQGLWNGINNTKDWIVNKVKGFAGDVLGGIKNFFGIKSPSTVFAEVGVNLNRGLAKGIAKSTGLVTKAVDTMATDALATISGVNESLASGFNSTVTTSQNIQSGNLAPAAAVVQNNTFNVANNMDVQKISSDLGYAVAMA